MSDSVKVRRAHVVQLFGELLFRATVPQQRLRFRNKFFPIANQAVLLGSEDYLSLNLVFPNECLELVELYQFDIDIKEPLRVALHLLKYAGEGGNTLTCELRRSERTDVEL